MSTKIGKPYQKKSRPGIWWVEVRKRDGARKQVRLKAKNRDDADVERAEMLKGEMEDPGRGRPISDPPLSWLVSKHLEWTAATKAEGTYRTKAYHLNRLLAWLPEGLTYSELTPDDVQQWLSDDYDGCSETTKNCAYRQLNACFNWAAHPLRRYIGANICQAVETPQAESRALAYVTAEEWNKIVLFLRDDAKVELLDIFTVMRHTGCRPHEARTVEARWLDHDRRTWNFPTKGMSKKDKRRGRVVYVQSDTAWSICQRWALKNPEGPIFRNSKGNPWTNHAYRKQCERIREKCGLRDFTPYMLRHTFCTDAIKRGVDLPTLQKLMGHSDVKMILSVYSHMGEVANHIEDAQRRIIEGDITLAG